MTVYTIKSVNNTVTVYDGNGQEVDLTHLEKSGEFAAAPHRISRSR